MDAPNGSISAVKADSLLSLPTDLLHHLFHFIPLSSLPALALTSTRFASFVDDAFRFHALKRLSYSPLTLAHAHRHWSWSKKCEWATRIAKNWARWNCGGEGLGGGGDGRTWARKCMPVIHLWSREDGRGRVVIGKGTGVEVWEVDEHGRSWDMLEGGTGSHGVRPSKPPRAGLDDVTGLASVTGHEDDLVLSRVSGVIQRMRYEPVRTPRGERRRRLVETVRYATPPGHGTVQALASDGPLLVAASTARAAPHRAGAPGPLHAVPDALNTHRIAIYPLAAPWRTPPTTFAISTKPWSLLLSPSAPTPTWLAVGASGETPLSIYTLYATGEPMAYPRFLGGNTKKTAVYDLAAPSALSAFLRPDETVIAAFYDSTTRIYDLRSPSSLPSIELSDTWNDDPSYSVASGGPGGAYVVVGTARNSALKLFDIRAAGAVEGITAFAPGKDSSPVYGVQMEGARVWGVTERRGFVLDFSEGRNDGAGDVKYYEHGTGSVRLKTTGNRGREGK